MCGGTFWETASGEQCVLYGEHPPDPHLAEYDKRLLESRLHPLILVNRLRLTPVDLAPHALRAASGRSLATYALELKSAGLKVAYLLPLRDAKGAAFAILACGTNPESFRRDAVFVQSECLDELTAQCVGVEAESEPTVRDILTFRERQCLIFAANGFTEKYTARVLQISPNTVHAHIESCKRKLGARNKQHAIVLALKRFEIRLTELG